MFIAQGCKYCIFCCFGLRVLASQANSLPNGPRRLIDDHHIAISRWDRAVVTSILRCATKQENRGLARSTVAGKAAQGVRTAGDNTAKLYAVHGE